MHIEHLFDSITPQESIIIYYTQHEKNFANFFSFAEIASAAWQISDAIRNRESEYVMRSIIRDLFIFFIFGHFDRISQTHAISNPLFIGRLDGCLAISTYFCISFSVNVICWRFCCYCYCKFFVLMLFVHIDVMIKRSQSVCVCLLPFGK